MIRTVGIVPIKNAEPSKNGSGIRTEKTGHNRLMFYKSGLFTGYNITPIKSIKGGEGGIRTLDAVARMLVFETSAFDHSATSPLRTAVHYTKERLSVRLGRPPRACRVVIAPRHRRVPTGIG